MRRALVAGGTGFIGSALVRRLSEPATDGPNLEEVLLAVRPGSNAAELAALPRVRCVPYAQLREQPACDTVFNLASYGVRPGQLDTHEMLQGNLGIACQLLELARDWRSDCFVHTGSCSEYASVEAPVLLDETSLCAPASLYGAAKAATSLYCAGLANEFGVPWVCLRLFGTYGPGEAEHRLIPSLVGQLLQGKSAEMSAGLQVRDLCYVEDVVDALLLAAAAIGRLERPSYNVCSGRPTSIADTARLVVRALGCSDAQLALGALPMRPGEQMWVVGSSQRFREATGWAPRISLEQGVRRTVEHFKSAFEAKVAR